MKKISLEKQFGLGFLGWNDVWESIQNSLEYDVYVKLEDEFYDSLRMSLLHLRSKIRARETHTLLYRRLERSLRTILKRP